MDILIDIVGIGRRIVQLAYLICRGVDETDAVGRADSNLSVWKLCDVLHVVDGIVTYGLPTTHLYQLAVEASHPETAFAVVEQLVDMVVLQHAILLGIELTRSAVLPDLVDALSVGGCKQRRVRRNTQAQHHRALTSMNPLSRQRVMQADTVVGTHDEHTVGQLCHTVHVVVLQRLLVLSRIC